MIPLELKIARAPPKQRRELQLLSFILILVRVNWVVLSIIIMLNRNVVKDNISVESYLEDEA